MALSDGMENDGGTALIVSSQSINVFRALQVIEARTLLLLNTLVWSTTKSSRTGQTLKRLAADWFSQKLLEIRCMLLSDSKRRQGRTVLNNTLCTTKYSISWHDFKNLSRDSWTENLTDKRVTQILKHLGSSRVFPNVRILSFLTDRLTASLSKKLMSEAEYPRLSLMPTICSRRTSAAEGVSFSRKFNNRNNSFK
ncbi:hypothetical protein Rs2_23711 [Raphanus sativus]|nr:hypothetical protein Rs2_23711 [Raphanus sativus]